VTPRASHKRAKLPSIVSDYLSRLEANAKAETEAIIERAISDALHLDIPDLWDQRELATSYWILLMTGGNQEEEMSIATAILTWKAFLAKDFALVRCIQTSDTREFACCQSRIGLIQCPTLVLSNSLNVESFISLGPELLFKLNSILGCMHRFLTAVHQLIVSERSLREVDALIRTDRFWSTIRLDHRGLQESVLSAIIPSWRRVSSRKGNAKRRQPGQKRWIPGAFSELATLIDPNAVELRPIWHALEQALGCPPSQVIADSCSGGVRDVASTLYEVTRCTTGLQYDWEPANPGEVHQEVRLAGEVLRSGVATCLDLALLYAALLERAHMAPAVFLLDTGDGWHALGGFFNNDSHAQTPVVLTEPGSIRQLIRSGDVLPIETTFLAAAKGKKKTYTQACKEGVRLVANTQPIALINVLAARYQGIKPPQ
jgi:hypothetical protein